jgi:ABC-type Fe3+-hydroxamate transport system substrate-binding protein
VRALAPTHVILNVDENRKTDAQALAGFVPTLVVTHPLAPLDNLALYRLIGGIFGREREAESLCERFEAEYAALETASRTFSPERTLYLIWKDPWMTVSRDTYVSRMLALVGWETIPERAVDRYPRISLADEDLGEARIVLLSSEPYRFGESHASALRGVFPARAVALIDGEMTAWYGSRAITALGYLLRFRQEFDRRRASPAI